MDATNPDIMKNFLTEAIVILMTSLAFSSCSDNGEDIPSSGNIPQSSLNGGFHDNKVNGIYGRGFDKDRMFEIMEILNSDPSISGNEGVWRDNKTNPHLDQYEIDNNGLLLFSISGQDIAFWASADGMTLRLTQLHPGSAEMFPHFCAVRDLDLDPSTQNLDLAPGQRLINDTSAEETEKNIFYYRENIDAQICGSMEKPSSSEYIISLPANKSGQARRIRWVLEYDTPYMVSLDPPVYSTRAMNITFIQLPDGYNK